MRPIRYQQVMKVLEARIVSGIYPLGELLPSEAALCQEFSISRYTVREALRQLGEKRLITRRQGAGSIVASNVVHASYSLSLQSLSELSQYATVAHYRTLQIEECVLDERTATSVRGKAGERWTTIAGLRSVSEDAEPFSYVHSYLPERLAWIVPELPGCTGSFFFYIERRVNEPIVSADQDISAAVMPAEVATALGHPEGTVGLLLLRRYMSAVGTLIASFNWHVASEFTYRMTLHKGSRPV